MKLRVKLFIAVASAWGLLLAPGAFTAAQEYGNPAQDGAAGQPPSTQLSDKKLNQFIGAYSDVQTIREDFSAKVQGVQDRSRVQALQQKAQSEMIEAVQEAGLSVPEYNQIAALMDSDPTLRQKVLDGVKQR